MSKRKYPTYDEHEPFHFTKTPNKRTLTRTQSFNDLTNNNKNNHPEDNIKIKHKEWKQFDVKRKHKPAQTYDISKKKYKVRSEEHQWDYNQYMDIWFNLPMRNELSLKWAMNAKFTETEGANNGIHHCFKRDNVLVQDWKQDADMYCALWSFTEAFLTSNSPKLQGLGNPGRINWSAKYQSRIDAMAETMRKIYADDSMFEDIVTCKSSPSWTDLQWKNHRVESLSFLVYL